MWPIVTPDDDGIRPAGPPDECFFCCVKVGHPHGPECVTVLKRIEMRVRAQMPDGTVFTGLWQLDEPHSWDGHMSEFHKNESSWCAGNFVEAERSDVRWDGDSDPWAALTALYNPDEGECLCNVLSFEFVRTVDDTPKRNERKE